MKTQSIDENVAVRTSGLMKQFGKNRIAVDSLDLDIRKGEILSLLGPNGAGKTTTIKMLCCLLKPTGGTARIMGLDILKNPAKIKQIINVSPQETAVAPHLSVFENLVLVGQIYGLSGREAKRRAHRLVDLMSLNERLHDRANKLSGGLLRRLSIAMALISDPKVLFLDEPTLGLDPKARKSLWSLIRFLRGKKTILLTTHYLEEADALADRIAIIDQGRLIALGTSEELKSQLGGMQVMTVKADSLSLAAVKSLKRIYPGVTATGSKLVIEDEKLDFNRVVDILRSGGAKITWLSMKEPTLDEIYLKITGRSRNSEII